MKNVIYILFLVIFNDFLVFSQPNFSLQNDSVCLDAPFSPMNSSPGSGSYLWHFNSANMDRPNIVPTGENLSGIGFLSSPYFITNAEDNGNYYTFSTNYTTQNITRSNFSNSFSKNPVSDNIKISAFSNTYILKGIQIVKDASNNWYGFLVGGKGAGNARLTCLSFGSSLNYSPSVVYNTTFSMNFPSDLTLINNNGQWIGFTVNQLGNSITRFVFASGLNTSPSAVNLSFESGKLLSPISLSKPIKDNIGNWHILVTCFSNDTIKRIAFGNSLLNPKPILTNIQYSGLLKQPAAIRIIKDCEKTFGLVTNSLSAGFLVQLNFMNGIENDPDFKSLGNLGSLNVPYGMTDIIRDNNDIYTLIVNSSDKSISRIHYQPGVAPPTSTIFNPTSMYSDTGVFNINLIDTDTRNCFCKPIKVVDKPHVNIGNDTTICPYDKLLIDPKYSFNSYLWNNHAKSNTIEADSAGLYWLEVSNSIGCTDRDTIIVYHKPDNLFLGNDTTLTLGQPIILDVGNQYLETYWSTGETGPIKIITKPGIYGILVKDAISQTRKFCTFMDTILINLTIDVPNFFTPNNDGYNDTWKPNLFYHYPEAVTNIYDRFGKLVAHFQGDSEGWDGTYNNKTADTDTYWYVIDLKDGSKPIRGPLTIKTK